MVVAPLLCAGIFDGHRGSQAAEFAAQHFQERLQSNWQASSASAALQATFLSLDASFGQLQVFTAPFHADGLSLHSSV